MSLLDEAKLVRTRKVSSNGSREEAELVEAYFGGVITMRQLATAMGWPHPGSNNLPSLLRRCVAAGHLRVELVKKDDDPRVETK